MRPLRRVSSDFTKVRRVARFRLEEGYGSFHQFGMGDHPMDIVGAAEIVSAIAVLIGFGFAMVEMRRYRRRKVRETALELVKSYQTPEFAVAITLLIDLPEGLTKQQLEEHLREDMRLISLLMTTWESLGVLTFRHEVSLEFHLRHAGRLGAHRHRQQWRRGNQRHGHLDDR